MAWRLDVKRSGNYVVEARVMDGYAPVLWIEEPTQSEIDALRLLAAAPALLAACEAARAFVDPSLPGASRMYAQLDAVIAAAKDEATS